ncbi:MAG TPA: hypothetical protein VFL63_09835 [Rhodanobacteraceae bacterium]|nr:hypothetical protein [Rhodanobacteraceae bacterium]
MQRQKETDVGKRLLGFLSGKGPSLARADRGDQVSAESRMVRKGREERGRCKGRKGQMSVNDFWVFFASFAYFADQKF